MKPIPFYRWPICPRPTHQQVTGLVSEMAALLDERLVGIYLHGSLALGSFNPTHSDLDLLVVTLDGLPLDLKRRFYELLLARSTAPHPVEISVLARDQLLPWRYPTPYDLHYSESWRARVQEHLATGAWEDGPHFDPDLAAHVTVLHARGIVLRGAAIAETFPPIPAAHYRDSLALDLHDSLAAMESDPVYSILNCCRSVAYLHDGAIRTKAEGGEWALATLPPSLHPLIHAALAAYRSESARPSFELLPLREFGEAMQQALAPLLERE